ncbi:MAG: acetyl-CoA acetyltransferase [Sphingomonadales bacterium]|nr:acetyl-CoA acetyltransferase [Sphingomonadales bacterium]
MIVGVGQYSERPDDTDYRALSPMGLAGRALAAAIGDCRESGDVAAAIDTVAAIRQFEISTPVARAPFGKSDNPPRSIAARVGADPERAILEMVGGQGPQKLVGELAADIAAGDCGMAAIVGSEAISTALTLAGRGEAPDWSEKVGGQLDDRGYGMKGLLDASLIAHGLAAPIPIYALFENARRAEKGLSLDQYRRAMGELFAPFSEIAAGNPHAAAPIARSAEELAAVTERNRIVAEPYPRMTVARDQVNQAAAILIASAGKARRLGVPEERWVHIHGVAGATEASVLERADLATSPASIASVRAALDSAGIGIADIRYFDLYSCFAIAVFNIIDAFAIEPDDPRGLTLTGGLPFFGGAGNNYSSHAIAEAVQRLRGDPQSYALIGANGGFMSKYATGILSARPADWSDGSRWRTLANAEASVAVEAGYTGEATIESYTIIPGIPGRSGDHGAVVARTPAGHRCVANPADQATLGRLSESRSFGRRILVSPDESNKNTFSFAE